MKKVVELLKQLKEYIIPKDAEIQVAAFNILAVCGIVVSIITAFINAISGNNIIVVFKKGKGDNI